MRNGMMVVLGMAAVLVSSLVLPARAEHVRDRGGWRVQVLPPVVKTVEVRREDNKDDARLMLEMYCARQRDYDGIDPVTGERIGALLQMVVETGNDYVVVQNALGDRQRVALTPRTELTFQPQERDRHARAMGERFPKPGPIIATRLQCGDLLIVEGYLRGGEMAATRIRVIGQVGRWGDDEDRPTYGFRVWGEVRDVRHDRRTFDVAANIGTRTVQAPADIEILADGRPISINSLRRGDRVVVYYRAANAAPLDAYRVVVLSYKQDYPDGDRPYWADPRDERPGGDQGHGEGPRVEGRLEFISASAYMDKLVLRDEGGRQYTVRAPKEAEAVAQNGDRIAIEKLRAGDRLRVYYREVAGMLYAQRIEIR